MIVDSPIVKCVERYDLDGAYDAIQGMEPQSRAVFESFILLWTGKYENGREILTIIDQNDLSNTMKYFYYLIKGSLDFYMGKYSNDFSQIIREIDRATISKEDLKFLDGRLAHLEAAHLTLRGELKEAIKKYKQSLLLKEEIGDNFGKLMTMNNLAMTHFKEGEIKDALNLLEGCLSLVEVYNGNPICSTVYMNLAIVEFHLGWVNNARSNIQRAIARFGKEIGKDFIATAYKVLGQVEIALQNYSEGMYNLYKAQKLFDELSNPYESFDNLFEICRVKIMRHEDCTEEIDRLMEFDDILDIPIKKVLIRSLVLSTKSLIQKIGALNMLEPMLEKFISSFLLEVQILTAILTIRIDLEMYERNPENYIKIKSYIDRLQDIAQKQNSDYLLLNTTMFSAMLQLVHGDVDNALISVNEVVRKASTMGNLNLLSIMERQYSEFEETASRWSMILGRNPEFIRQKSEKDIKDYLERVANVINRDFI